ncbi:AAA family ATPase [Candidatus Woesebacteria bacterium]|nr:AAA family ATPase [Candidatus Woesebacteria bacterium]
MAGIFDFIKKKTQNATDPQAQTPQSSGTPSNPAQQQQVQVVSQSIQQPVQKTQSYNGIGTSPSGSSYNGIGSAPVGQRYSGIGSPSTSAIPYSGINSDTAPQTVISSPPPSASPKSQPSSLGSNVSKSVQSTTITPADSKLSTGAQSSSVKSAVNPAIRKDTINDQLASAPQDAKNTVNNSSQKSKVAVGTPSETAPNDMSQKQLSSTDNTTSQNGSSPSAAGQTNQPQALQSTINNKKRAALDVMTHLTHRSNAVFMQANNKALELHNQFVDSEHLLAGLLTDGEIFKIFVDLKMQPQVIEQELIKNYKKESFKEKPQLSPRVKQIIENALDVARKLGYEFISPEHLLLALFDEGEGVGARVLTKLGLQKEDLNKRITGKKEGVTAVKPGEATVKQQKEQSALAKYTIDLTKKAENHELDPVVERSEVIERVIHILSRRIKNNPALIGEPGVGKTAIVEGLAQRIVDHEVPEGLLNKRIAQLDLASIIAGASHRGEFEERMKALVDELKANNDKYILFIDEMHTMMGAGSGEGALDASNFIKPALARGEIQFIGATTITEYRKYIEKDAALERRFQTVLVPEPKPEAAIKMLKASRDKYEAFHKVKIPDETIELAVKLSKRYIGDRFLPDKAFDLMDEAAAAVRLPLISLPEEIKSIEARLSQLQQELKECETKGDEVRARITRSKIQEVQDSLKGKQDEYNMRKAQTTTRVTDEIIKSIIAERTGIPVSRISTTEGDKLVKLEDIIHKRMVDQERAVAAVSQAIRRGRAGLKSNKRPIGSFVFLGPTGVGKTELAKTVSEVLFDDEEAIIRFDMTEYMERHEVAKLLGPPPGYVGFEEGGKLTEAVRRKPYSLVLFDEIEKAHPDIFNILLQILDDGRLTDNKGRTISFKNTVVICTSNIGTKMIQDEMLKSGNNDVSEPPVLSTYTFTPRGREILTIGNKYFERDGVKQSSTGSTPTSAATTTSVSKDNMSPTKDASQSSSASSWADHTIVEYFAGQKIQGKEAKKTEAPMLQDQQTESTDEQKDRSPTTDQQTAFPTFGYDTQAISPQGVEVVTKGGTVFMRNATTSKVWEVTNLIDYFAENVVVNALPDAPDEQLPTIRLKTHAFSPDETQIVTFKNRFWKRKPGTKDWETGLLKDYFGKSSTESLPISHWDIHTFSPKNREIIIMGNFVWFKDPGQMNWIKQSLSDYFGVDFPLDKELEEKEKIDLQSGTKHYDLIKERVMNELLKFFRPELVNRFDEVIVFEPLKFVHMIDIVKLQLKSVTKLLEEQNIGFNATDSAIKAIVKEGFDPIFGARPLRRAIQRLVENPISEMIIAKKVKDGDIIEVDYNGEELMFNVVTGVASGSYKASDEHIAEHIRAYCQTNGSTLSRSMDNATPLCKQYWAEQETIKSSETKKTSTKPSETITKDDASTSDIKKTESSSSPSQKDLFEDINKQLSASMVDAKKDGAKSEAPVSPSASIMTPPPTMSMPPQQAVDVVPKPQIIN